MKAYRRQCASYVAWLTSHGEHPDAFVDVVGAEAAVTASRRHLLRRRLGPATVNQALAAVTLTAPPDIRAHSLCSVHRQGQSGSLAAASIRVLSRRGPARVAGRRHCKPALTIVTVAGNRAATSAETLNG